MVYRFSNNLVSYTLGQSLVIENRFVNFTWYFLIFNRQQKEREIRHKIKKGDLADIPKDVLETMAPSLLMPSKGMLDLQSFVWMAVIQEYQSVITSDRWIKLNWSFKSKTIAEICLLRTAILYCTWART